MPDLCHHIPLSSLEDSVTRFTVSEVARMAGEAELERRPKLDTAPEASDSVLVCCGRGVFRTQWHG